MPAAVEPRAFDTLVALVERAGHLVTKEELFSLVWPRLVVEENNLMLSTIYGTLLALLMPAVDIAWAILLGGFYGLALYYINFYGFNAFSPWFAEQRDWVSIASHFVFGASSNTPIS